MSGSAQRRANRAHISEQGRKASRIYSKNTADIRKVEQIDKQMKVDFDAFVKTAPPPIILRAIASWLPPVWWATFVAQSLGYLPPVWLENLLAPSQSFDKNKKLKALSPLQRIHLAVCFPFKALFIVLRKVISVLLVEWMLPFRRTLGGNFITGIKKVNVEKKFAHMILRRFGKEIYRKDYSW